VVRNEVDGGKEMALSEEYFVIFLNGTYYLFLGIKYKRR